MAGGVDVCQLSVALLVVFDEKRQILSDFGESGFRDGGAGVHDWLVVGMDVCELSEALFVVFNRER